ncbi:MAG: aminotransferase class V-fold PLP-dependent enzyme [Planctomycetota bacterium]|nr:aminotransferase class V-fold PLP-dependent enzyme [Planctomycetota bacterium]
MTPLYLDTARLGLMSPGARSVYRDFVEFVGEAGLSLYAEDFLRDGAASLSPEHRQRFPQLADWHGVDGLKRRLRQTVAAPSELPLLLASRTTVLMRLAARLLFRFCENVLTADLAWPAYAEIVRREAMRTESRLASVPLRPAVFREGVGAAEITERLTEAAVDHGCDGLFLPAVSHDGVRLPVREIVRRIERRTELRFVVIDGAQAFGHVPLDLSGTWCDLLLGGCHKWLGAYHPLGLGFCGRPRAAGPLGDALRSLKGADGDDPLLSFLEDQPEASGETVNVGTLFSCHGALNDSGRRFDDPSFNLNRTVLGECLAAAGWKARSVDESVRSGILLGAVPNRVADSAENIRRTLCRHGVAATAYPHGAIRLSTPLAVLTDPDVDLLVAALRALG